MKLRRCPFRTTIKWIATCAAVLLLILWIGSARYSCYYNRSQSGFVGVGRGQAIVTWQGEWYYDPPEKWSLSRNEGRSLFRWWWTGDLGPLGPKHIAIPLWMPALLFAVPAVLMWQRDRVTKRRLAINHCEHCNYNRTGLPPERPCPECGKPI